MKKLLLFAILSVFFASCVNSSKASAEGNCVMGYFKCEDGLQHDEDGVYDVAEIMPKYPDGNEALMEYIAEKVKNANWDRESCAQGRVVVGFIVETDGSISNVKVLRSVEPSRDKTAAKIVQEMPKWIPGKRNGKAVRVRYNVPVNFKQ